jgi:hypothetical protein
MDSDRYFFILGLIENSKLEEKKVADKQLKDLKNKGKRR